MIRMNMLNDEEIHLKFLMNLPVYVEGIGNFYVPLLSEIVDMTESKYGMSISALLYNKNKSENKDELSHLTNFQAILYFICKDSHFREMFLNGLCLSFKKQPFIHIEEEFPYICFDEYSQETVLNEDKLTYIQRLIAIANSIKQENEEEEIVAGNERARLFMEQQKKRKAMLAKYKKETINLHSIISAVGWKAQSFEFINKLNIYQLYDGYGRLQYIDSYHYTMSGIHTGIYSGTVNPKDVKLSEINWANIIQQK